MTFWPSARSCRTNSRPMPRDAPTINQVGIAKVLTKRTEGRKQQQRTKNSQVFCNLILILSKQMQHVVDQATNKVETLGIKFTQPLNDRFVAS